MLKRGSAAVKAIKQGMKKRRGLKSLRQFRTLTPKKLDKKVRQAREIWEKCQTTSNANKRKRYLRKLTPHIQELVNWRLKLETTKAHRKFEREHNREPNKNDTDTIGQEIHDGLNGEMTSYSRKGGLAENATFGLIGQQLTQNIRKTRQLLRKLGE